MLTTNDIARIQLEVQRLVDVYWTETATITNDAPETVYRYDPQAGEAFTVTVHCLANRDGVASYHASKVRSFLYDGTTLTQTDVTDLIAPQYLGSGLSYCSVLIEPVGGSMEVQFSGEATGGESYPILVHCKIQINSIVYSSELT